MWFDIFGIVEFFSELLQHVVFFEVPQQPPGEREGFAGCETVEQQPFSCGGAAVSMASACLTGVTLGEFSIVPVLDVVPCSYISVGDDVIETGLSGVETLASSLLT